MITTPDVVLDALNPEDVIPDMSDENALNQNVVDDDSSQTAASHGNDESGASENGTDDYALLSPTETAHEHDQYQRELDDADATHTDSADAGHQLTAASETASLNHTLSVSDLKRTRTTPNPLTRKVPADATQFGPPRFSSQAGGRRKLGSSGETNSLRTTFSNATANAARSAANGAESMPGWFGTLLRKILHWSSRVAAITSSACKTIPKRFSFSAIRKAIRFRRR